MESGIELEGVSKSFGSTRALRDVSLALPGGEVLAVVGANGAGKSTLNKLLAGVLAPDTGTVRIDGAAVEFASPLEARQAGIETVHQHASEWTVPGMSAAENLLLDRFASGEDGGWVSPRRLVGAGGGGGGGAGAGALAQRAGRRRDAPERVRAPADRAGAGVGALAAAARARRADLGAGRRGGRAAVRDRAAAARARASRSSTSRTGWARSRRWRIASRCCATGAWRPSSRGRSRRRRSCTRCSARSPTTSRRVKRREGGATVVRLEGARVFADSVPFDLELRGGEVLGLTGLIGAGKSELLGALFGLRPLAGGHDPARRRGARAGQPGRGDRPRRAPRARGPRGPVADPAVVGARERDAGGARSASCAAA